MSSSTRYGEIPLVKDKTCLPKKRHSLSDTLIGDVDSWLEKYMGNTESGKRIANGKNSRKASYRSDKNLKKRKTSIAIGEFEVYNAESRNNSNRGLPRSTETHNSNNHKSLKTTSAQAEGVSGAQRLLQRRLEKSVEYQSARTFKLRSQDRRSVGGSKLRHIVHDI